MEWLVHAVARLVRAAKTAYAEKMLFSGLFLFVFIVSVVVLAKLDLLPESKKVESAPLAALVATSTPVAMVPELPVRISIPSISLEASVSNPESTSIAVLDAALLSGAVRYPTSGKLGEENANVVLFGHSSYLPVVKNQGFKIFNGIQKLRAGDTIVVYSAGTAYTYAVESVSKQNTASAGIPLVVDGKKLTLSTCDSFGSTTDRFVVVANFVESHTHSD